MIEAKAKVLDLFLEIERKGLPVVDIVYLLAEFQQDYTVRLRGEIAHYQMKDTE